MVPSNEMLWKILVTGEKFSGKRYGPNDCIAEFQNIWTGDSVEANKLVLESSTK